MEIKVFTDVIDALEKVAGHVSAAITYEKRQREKYITAITETYTLLDSALLLILNRLSDIAHIEGDHRQFLEELQRVDESKDWLVIERDIRLCRNLRIAGGEIKSLYWKLKDKLSNDDTHNLKTLVDNVLEQEYQLANFISNALTNLAQNARSYSNEGDLRKNLLMFKKTVMKERCRLIESELEFLKAVTDT